MGWLWEPGVLCPPPRVCPRARPVPGGHDGAAEVPVPLGSASGGCGEPRGGLGPCGGPGGARLKCNNTAAPGSRAGSPQGSSRGCGTPPVPKGSPLGGHSEPPREGGEKGDKQIFWGGGWEGAEQSRVYVCIGGTMGIFWGVLAASSQGGGAFLVPHTPEALWCAEGRCRRGAVCRWGVPALGTEPPGTLGPLRPRHHTGVGGTPPCHLPSVEGSLRPPAPPEWPGGHWGGGIPSTGGSRLSSLPHRALVNAELLCFLFFSFLFLFF